MDLKFGTSGIRGIVNETLFFEDIVKLAYSCISVVKGPYCIARDERKNSPLIYEILKTSLNLFGEDVLEFGPLPTPVLAFGTRLFKRKLGFQVTASHNPPPYTGIKIFNSKGMQLPRLLELKIEKMLKEKIIIESPKRGSLTHYDGLKKDYIRKAIETLPKTKRKLRILVDSGNGMASLIIPEALKLLGHDVISINENPIWNFPSRPSEPTPQNLFYTSKMVSKLDLDLAFAYDGDGDRAVLINREGKVLPDHIFTSLVLMNLLREKKGNVVISVNTSNCVEEVALKRGCKVIRARLGKTYERLVEKDAIFASEPSKIINPDWGLWEDGMYASLFLIQNISSEEISVEEMSKDLPLYHYKQLNLPIGNLNYEKLEKSILKENFGEVKEIDKLDGIKLIFDDSWILFRLSGTEPKARIYAESKDYNKVKRLLQKGKRIVSTLSFS
ncbi:MAG: hypothetical protein QXX95_07495 [Nitrososphaerales archaeon]